MTGTASTLDMLATLYRARGKLAQPSVAGLYFMPLYEKNMGRITELVSRDPALQEMTVNGLRQIEPALNALSESEGQKFKLSKPEMAEIEAALRRLAQDDRLFSGGGQLAKLIEHELKWLRLPTYAGMTYAAGFKRLNREVTPLSETAPPPTTTLVDPNCENTYSNVFHLYNFSVSTPGHDKPNEASPIEAGGVVCGTAVKMEGGDNECHAEKTLNTGFALKMPPGDKVNSTKAMKEGAFVGWTTGHVVGCAGTFSEIVPGKTEITAVKSPTVAQCPESVIGCYKTEGTDEADGATVEFHGYAYVEETEERLVLRSKPVKARVKREIPTKEEFEMPVGFSEFGVKLCAHANESGTEKCGSPAEPWVHKNGEESLSGCSAESSSEAGHFVMTVTNEKKEENSAERCVYWGERAHKQTVDSSAGLNAVSCVPKTADCVAVDSKGKAFYSTNASAITSAVWKSWSGPTGTSSGEAIACPTISLCALADGNTEKSGGNMYYATSLGGAWTEAFKPSNGALAVSCPSSSFCVAAQEGGRIRYSTKPGSTSWTEETIGSGALNGVFCLSSSFCAVVNGAGDLYVADTEAKVKEASGWKKTDVDGSIALHGVACTSTTSCVAVDGEGNVLDLTINGSGEATPSKHDLDGSNDLTAVTCTSEDTCVAVDHEGNILVSADGGKVWNVQYPTGTELTSVSCADVSLCITADTSGNVTAFTPVTVPPGHAKTIDAGNSLGAVSCVANTDECVATDSNGNALYSTDAGSTSAKWTSWTAEAGPSEAVACPTNTLCALADGKAEKGTGGNMYYATSLGGEWKEAFAPVWGVNAISCPTSSFCVAGQGEGFIRYTTNPASSEWKTVSVATSAVNAVDCLSSSFCALVDNTGHVRVADTGAKIKEETGWKSTDVDGTHALRGIVCTATTWCIAIDGEGHVLDLTIKSSGEATVSSKEDVDGANSLTAITCTGEEACVATDSKGNVLRVGERRRNVEERVCARHGPHRRLVSARHALRRD